MYFDRPLFLSPTVPIQKLENPLLKSFLEKISGNKVKTAASYRNSTLKILYDVRKKEFQDYFIEANALYIILMRPQIVVVDTS